LKLQEFESLNLFNSVRIPVPRHFLVTNPDDAVNAFRKLSGPVILKAQILVAGRGKAGGIILAHNAQEVKNCANALLNKKIKGILVNSILVEEKLDIQEELFLGIAIDRFNRKPVIIASAKGGVDIEETVKKDPKAVVKKNIDPSFGLKTYQARSLAKNIGLSGKNASEYTNICLKLYKLFEQYDCELIESNPLTITNDGRIIAADARMIIDDNAKYRHSNLKGPNLEISNLEREAEKVGLSFVQLNGDIGIIGNGAGLVMATMDVVLYFGGQPANFLDVGGGADSESIYNAVRITLSNSKVKVLLVNILGGITRCDVVAEGLVAAVNDFTKNVPIVVRLVGTGEEEGRIILKEAGLNYMESMDDAAKKAVSLLGSF